MNKIKTKLILWLALPAILLSSCVMGEEEDVIDGGTNVTNSKVDVRVTLQMPASSAPKTYAISEIDENQVKEIDVLVFNAAGDDWKFAYSAQGHTISDVTESNPTKAKKQFTVTLIKNTAPQTFVILANARKQLVELDGISEGAEKDLLLARLKYNHTGKWNAKNYVPGDDTGGTFDAFPMWGEKEVTLTDATTEITGISLLRAVARLDVVLSDAVKDAGKFTLDKIYVYNSKNTAHIVPNPNNLASLEKVNAATEPSDSDINNTPPLIYDVPSSMNKAFEQSMYLFEAAGKAQNKSSEATCVVVGGKYDNTDAPTTYYRLDFLKRPDIDETYYRDILRNHKYRMNITSVTGSGYATPEEAFNSKSMNMVAEVLYWDDGQGGDVVFDGQYYLSVKPEMVYNLQKDADQDVVRVKTDVPNGFQIVKITEADGTTTNSGWLTTDKTSGATNTETAVTIRVSANEPALERTGYIIVKAGRLEAKIKVTQSTTPKRIGVFTFKTYTNVNGTGQAIPATGGEIKATVNTNMGWTLRTDIDGLEISMADPASETAADYTLSVNIPANQTWDTVDRKVWVEYKGLALQETTFTQAGYSITPTATPVTRKTGGTSIVTITGYRPLIYIRAITGTTVLDSGEVAPGDTAAGTGSLDIDDIGSETSRLITIQWSKDGLNWADITSFTQSVSIAAKFARSNIVWDGTKLTFATTAAENVTIPESSQGVLFKWGSLVAISPAGTDQTFTSGHIVFSATGTYSYNWDSIPYANENSGKFANNTTTEDDFLGYDGDTNTSGPGYNTKADKGDICRYISNQPGWNKGKWRLPTSDEYDKLIAEQGSVHAGTFVNINVSPSSPATNNNGYYVPSAGFWVGSGGEVCRVYFPAGGARDYAGGPMGYCGYRGYAWSGSSNMHFVQFLYIEEKPSMKMWYTDRNHAMPVRCVHE